MKLLRNNINENGIKTGLVSKVQEITSWINEPNVISLGGLERLASVLEITPPIWPLTAFVLNLMTGYHNNL